MNRSFFLRCAVLMLGVATTAGCGDDSGGESPNVGGNGDAGASACTSQTLTYENHFKGTVFSVCTTCHSAAGSTSLGGGIRLDSIENIRAKSADIIQHAVLRMEPAMPPPPFAALSDSERQNVQTWLNCGAP